jgi:hypothetical protein
VGLAATDGEAAITWGAVSTVILPCCLLLCELKEDCTKMCEIRGGQSQIKIGYLMAIREGLFFDGRRSKGFQWFPRVSHPGVQIYIWATVKFCLACLPFPKREHQKGKITRNLGFYFGKFTVNYKKGNPTR